MVTTLIVLTNIIQVSLKIRASQIVNYLTIIGSLYAAVLQKHKYESGTTMDKGTWGYRRNTKFTDFLTIENLIWQLVSTVRSVKKEGICGPRIDPIFYVVVVEISL